MKMSDMRAKARAIFGPAIAEPMPKQPNGAKALQERANARPIPTYKVGGAVKKNTPPQPTAAEREADRKRREEYAKMKPTKEQAAAITRGNRAADIEGGRYKKGGKVQTSADTAKKLATEMGGMKKGGKAKKDGLAVMIAIGEPMKGMKKPVKKAVGGVANRSEGRGRMDVRMKKKPMPPKTQPPSQEMMQKSADETYMEMQKSLANYPATQMPPPPPSSSGAEIEVVRSAPLPPGYAKGGNIKKPIKRAAGGAAKVRKGMMTPEGKITHAMNKIRGK
jgi:hypothetical protein